MVIDAKSLIWTGPGDVQFPLMLLWAAEIFFLSSLFLKAVNKAPDLFLIGF